MLMKKIINTFKYGDKKVKRSLMMAILAGVVTLVFAVLALALSNMLCFFVAIVAAFVTISLVQTFMIAEGENPTVARPAISVKQEEPEQVADNVVNSSLRTRPKKKKKTKKKKTKKEKTKKERIKKDKASRKSVAKEQYIEEEISEYNPLDETYKQEMNKYEAREEDADDSPDDYDNPKTKFKVITADTAATYTKKKIKKTLHKYKVIKDHRMVIVDRCDKLHIYQTPAYVWIQDNQFHILLIEEEPRLLMVPLFRITEITYLKKQPADEEKDYKVFKNSTILTESFRPYLPDYNHSNKTNDLTAYKNLYGISQGIYFTNNSAKNLFDLLGVDFYVEDKVTTSNKVNIFFKESYKANIKLRDNVIDANGYADSITKILDDMAHSSMSYNEFKDTLNLMIRNKLITDEYASHYMDVRNGLHG